MDRLIVVRFDVGMTLTRALVLTTAFCSAVTGGSLFAFSTFVMPALDRLPVGQALPAMQAINVAAPRGLFIVPLLGSAVGSAAVGVLALVRAQPPGRGWLLLGAAAGVAAFAVTAAYHVPRNDALALVQAASPEARARWTAYAVGWTRWNHLRTVLALASAVALLVGSRADR